jgi:hypothetical protein
MLLHQVRDDLIESFLGIYGIAVAGISRVEEGRKQALETRRGSHASFAAFSRRRTNLAEDISEHPGDVVRSASNSNEVEGATIWVCCRRRG